MTNSAFLHELRQIVGWPHVSAGVVATELYSYDASLAFGRPDIIVFPANTEQTSRVVAAACRAGVPYIPRGFATNLSGGSVAANGGLVISLNRMNRIVSIDCAARCAVVEPAVTNLELQTALSAVGFYFAPDPASQKVSTLAGNAAENSGGPHCVKYGVTTNHVLGLEVVLPGGETVETSGAALDPPGYDIRGLLIGSEGTLGIITRLTLRILPSSEGVATLLVVYDRPAEAAQTVSDIISAGIVPATLEMMDAPVIKAVEESFPCGYPLDAGAVLIIEVDGPSSGLRGQVARIKEICLRNGCKSVREAKDPGERDRLWAGRRGAFGAIARLAPNFLVADCTVPRTLLPEALARVGAIAKRYGLPHGNVFHAGDGNLHPLLFFDSRNKELVHKVHEAGWEIMQACVELGGTITGEHGVGLEKKDAMRLIFSEQDLDFQNRIRVTFDPDELLNPGKIFPDIKLTTLPPLQAPDGPDRRLVPESPEEAAEMVQAAVALRKSLLPLGKGRYRDYGNHSDTPLTDLSSERLDRILEYDPANQFVTVQTGVLVADLQKALIQGGQWLALRPWTGADGTIGAVAALNACGPERLRYGAPRDLALGLGFVSAQGRRVKGGGKVVKNVAGYDVTRLMIGSAGTLGFLSEVTFRVATMPESCCSVVVNGSLARCAALSRELVVSKLEPTFLFAAANRETAHQWTMYVGFEGLESIVEEQIGRAFAMAEKATLEDAHRVDHDIVAGPLEELIADWRQDPFLFRVDLGLGQLEVATALLMSLGGPSHVMIDFGDGRIRAGMERLPEPGWLNLAGSLTREGAHLVVEKAPTEFKRRQEAFAPVSGVCHLSSRLKEALDPTGVFAPGRLPGRN